MLPPTDQKLQIIATRAPDDDATMICYKNDKDDDSHSDGDDEEACHDNRYGTATLALGKPNLEKATLN